jgi:predicted aldo/keto reductase-like oxidoreductase
MEKRILGKTKEALSIIGFGGIVVAKEEQRSANNYVAEAIDSGVNYFDVAPTYFDAEDKLGLALENKRNGIFLACKTEDRSKTGAESLLHMSLKKLKTDYFDLYQLHAMYTMEDVERVFMPDGAMETFLKAKEKGLIRYIGFSAHSEEVAIALMNRYPFDSMLFPVNWTNIFNSGFGVKALEKAEETGIGRLAIKAMARTSLTEGSNKKYNKSWYEPIDDEELARLALRYTLSKPITAAIPPGEAELFRWALETAKNFKPITTEEEELLKSMSKGVKPLFPL